MNIKTEILKKDIKKGLRFYWNARGDYAGFYEVICFKRDFSIILCWKESGRVASINTEEWSKFDERIVKNPYFWKSIKSI